MKRLLNTYIGHILVFFQKGKGLETLSIFFILIFMNIGSSATPMIEKFNIPETGPGTYMACDNPPGPATILTTDWNNCNVEDVNIKADPSYTGTGIWSIAKGNGNILDLLAPSTTVTGMVAGDTVVIRWTVSNEDCDDVYDEITIYNGYPDPVMISNDPLCEGETLVLTVEHAEQYNSFYWVDKDDNYLGDGTSLVLPDVTADRSGEFSVYVLDNLECEQFASATVVIYPGAVADAGEDQFLCHDNTTTLEGNFPSFGSGTWTRISGSGIIDDDSDPETYVSDLGSGENVFVWTVTSDNSCPSAIDTVTISYGYPNPVIISNGPLCEGETLILTLEHPEHYEVINWYDGENNKVGEGDSLILPGVTADRSGLYETDMLDISGCEQSSTIEVMIYPGSIADAGEDQLLCNDNSTTLEANYPTFGSGTWTQVSGNGIIDDDSDPGTNVSDLGSGENVFVWTVTSDDGCTTAIDTVTISYGYPDPVIISNGPLCEGETLILTVEHPEHYEVIYWYDGGNNKVGEGDSLILPNVTADGSGLYEADMLDISGCEQSSTIEVVIYPGVIADAGEDQLLCNNNTTTLEGNEPSFGSGNWTLVSGSGSIDDESDPETNVSDLGSGENVFVWTIEPDYGCGKHKDTVTVTVGALAPVILGENEMCEGSTLHLWVKNPENYQSFEWRDPQGNIIGTGSDLSIPNLQAAISTIYSVRVTDSYGCQLDVNQSVIVYSLDPAVAGPDQFICDENTAILQANFSPNGSGTWKQISGSGIIVYKNHPTTPVFDLAPGENVFVWTRELNGLCGTSSDTVVVAVGGTAPVIVGDNVVCEGASLHLSVASPEDFKTFEWRNPENIVVSTSSAVMFPVVTSDMNGAYTLKVTDMYGCENETNVNIETFPVNSANAGSDQLICYGLPAVLNGNSPSYGNGKWTLISGNGIIDDPGNPKTEVKDLGSGENVLVWTMPSNGGCPPSSDTVIISYGYPDPVIISNGPLCEGDTLILTLEHPEYYEVIYWYDGENNKVGEGDSLILPGMTADMSGLYEADMLDISGCEQGSNMEVLIYPAALADAGEDQLLCHDNTTILEGNFPAFGSGRWTQVFGNGDIDDDSASETIISELSIGKNIFVWSIESDYGCGISKDTVTITVGYPAPEIISNAPLCEGTSLLLSLEDSSDYVSFQWVTSDSVLLGTAPILNLSAVSAKDAGIYSIVTTDIYGCQRGDSTNIEVVVPDRANAGNNQHICDDKNVLLDATMTAGNTGFWNVLEGKGNLEDPHDPKTIFANLLPGNNVTLTWTETNPLGCFDVDTLLLDYQSLSFPAYAGENFAVCLSDSVIVLNAGVPAYGGGEWTVTNGTASLKDKSDPHTRMTDFIPDSSGKLILRWKIDDSCHKGLDSSEDDVIIRFDHPAGPAKIITGDTSLCDVSQLTLQAEENYIGWGTWSVTSGSGVFVDSTQPVTEISELLLEGETVVQWMVTSGVCPSESSTLKITTGTMPDKAFAGPDQKICNDKEVTLAATPVEKGPGLWEIIDGPGSLLNTEDPSARITELSPGAGTTLIWVVGSGACPVNVDTLIITNDALPSIADAGDDQSLCNEKEIVLTNNNPIVGIGSWEIIDSSGHITSSGEKNTFHFATMNQPASLVYSIANGICPVSYDTVRFISYSLADQANAGEDIMTCENKITLNANPVNSGVGEWQITRGGGSLSHPDSIITDLSDLTSNDTVRLTWMVTNGTCPVNIDQIIVTTGQKILDPQAGKDLSPCSIEDVRLNAQTAPDGTLGMWNVVNGPGILKSPADADSKVSGLIPGKSTVLVWTLSLDACPDASDTLVIDNLDGDAIDANFLINGSACLGNDFASIDVTTSVDVGMKYKWLVDGESYYDVRDPIIMFSQAGLHTVQLEVSKGDCINISPEKEVEIVSCLSQEKDSTNTEPLNYVTVFPNPSNGYCSVEIEQTVEESVILIYNVSGNLIYSDKVYGHSIHKEITLDKSGFYFVHVINPKFKKVFKIIRL